MLKLVYFCEDVCWLKLVSRILWDFQGKKFPKLSIVKSADETDWIHKMGKITRYFVTVKFISKAKHFIGFNLAFLWDTFKPS